MNWLDIALAAIIVCSVIAGFSKGFARTALGFAATIFGLFCGLWFYGTVGASLVQWLSSRQLANLLGFFVIFISIVVIGALLGRLLEHVLRMAQLSWLNRLLGGAFGLLRGMLIGAVVVMAAMAFSVKPPPLSVAHSRLAPYAIGTANVLASAAPREVKDAFSNSYERIKQIWADSLKNGVRKLPEQTI